MKICTVKGQNVEQFSANSCYQLITYTSHIRTQSIINPKIFRLLGNGIVFVNQVQLKMACFEQKKFLLGS